MSQAQLDTNYLVEQATALSGQNHLPDWLQTMRREGLDQFIDHGFPTTKQESWRFTDFRPLKNATFQLAAPGHASASSLGADAVAPYRFAGLESATVVFVDGLYSAALSDTSKLPAEVQLDSLADLIDSPSDALKDALHEDDRGNPFAALNIALMQDGVYLTVPAGCVVETPVHLIFLSTGGDTALMAHPRTIISAGRGSQLTVIETYAGLGSGEYWTNPLTHIHLAQGANVDHYKMQREGAGAFHTAAMGVHLQRDAVFTSHAMTFGGKLTRNDIYAWLNAENINCTLNGLYVGSDRQHIDNCTVLEHAKPHCNSYQVYKGILDDKASGVFNGKIHVHQDAQKTDAKQTNRALLLTDKATINTKPELLIYADDVKCTHGATIGQLEDEAIFYLRSRGISEERARAMLTCAFGGEAIDDMKLDPIRDSITQMMLARFEKR